MALIEDILTGQQRPAIDFNIRLDAYTVLLLGVVLFLAMFLSLYLAKSV